MVGGGDKIGQTFGHRCRRSQQRTKFVVRDHAEYPIGEEKESISRVDFDFEGIDRRDRKLTDATCQRGEGARIGDGGKDFALGCPLLLFVCDGMVDREAGRGARPQSVATRVVHVCEEEEAFVDDSAGQSGSDAERRADLAAAEGDGFVGSAKPRGESARAGDGRFPGTGFELIDGDLGGGGAGWQPTDTIGDGIKSQGIQAKKSIFVLSSHATNVGNSGGLKFR